MDKPGLKRSITTLPAILLVMSAMIGSGVFKKIAPMSDTLQSPGLILACWAVAGIISLMGALCNAELASMMPGSGGEYIYFRKIYGRLFSFLYGWGNLTILKSASIAALAYIFAESFNMLFPLPVIDAGGVLGNNLSIKLLATLLIVILSYVNHRGVLFSGKLSSIFIVCAVIVILCFTAYAPFSGKGSITNFSHTAVVPQGWELITAFFAAATSAFWGYEGWNNLGYIGDEVKNPGRNIPLALGIGTLSVIILYLLINAVYLYVMPVEDLIAIHNDTNKIAAVEVARILSGQTGAVLLSTLILLTTFNCTNSTILTSSRIFYAMGRDGLFLKSAAKIHPVHQTPSNAIAWQGVWSVLLVWSGSFDMLTDLLIFASFIFYGAAALGVFILRKRDPAAVRPFRVTAYPLTPFIFFIFCALLVVITILSKPLDAAIGLALIFSGIPVFLYNTRKNKKLS